LRDDIVGAIRAPKAVQDFLVAIGGKNPHGEAQWRLIMASSRVRKEGGLFIDWDTNYSIQERGGFVYDETNTERTLSTLKPTSIRAELRTVKVYPGIEGWILEKWFPAHKYGSRESWLRAKVEGTDIPLLGPYPENGDYEMVSPDSSPRVPGFSLLREAVSSYEYARQAVEGTIERRTSERVNEAEFRMRAAEEKYAKYVQDYLRDYSKPIWGSSLAAGRMREELARKAGVKEHAGN
jgi:hypothetical protein